MPLLYNVVATGSIGFERQVQAPYDGIGMRDPPCLAYLSQITLPIHAPQAHRSVGGDERPLTGITPDLLSGRVGSGAAAPHARRAMAGYGWFADIGC